jgi:hypothetical protein
VTVLGLLGGLGVGVAFGYAAQRGAFCMSSGFRGALGGEWSRLEALGLAVAVQLLLLPLVFGSGLARPIDVPLQPAAAVVGGALFGVSMRWAGGCAAGVLYKLGAGDVGALPALLGIAVGALASEYPPLLTAREALQRTMRPGAAWEPSPAVSLGVGALVLAALLRLGEARAGAWTWRRTGLWIGVIGALAWPLSSAAGRDFGLAVVPGASGLLSAVTGGSFVAWDALLVLGMLAGGRLAASRSRSVAGRRSQARVQLRRFAGGLGLGVGATIAAGCTVGHGLTGLALLAPGSVLATAAIFGGSAVGEWSARRLEAASGRSRPLRWTDIASK